MSPLGNLGLGTIRLSRTKRNIAPRCLSWCKDDGAHHSLGTEEMLRGSYFWESTASSFSLVTMWINPDDFATSKMAILTGVNETGAYEWKVTLEDKSGSYARLVLRHKFDQGNSEAVMQSTQDIMLGKWNQIGIAFNSDGPIGPKWNQAFTTAGFLINGAAQLSDNPTLMTAAYNSKSTSEQIEVLLGSDIYDGASSTEQYHGCIDELTIWNIHQHGNYNPPWFTIADGNTPNKNYVEDFGYLVQAMGRRSILTVPDSPVFTHGPGGAGAADDWHTDVLHHYKFGDTGNILGLPINTDGLQAALSPDLESLTSSANILTNNNFVTNTTLTGWTTTNLTSTHLGGDGYNFKNTSGSTGTLQFDLSSILGASDIGKTYFLYLRLRVNSSPTASPILGYIKNTVGSTYNTATYHDFGYPSNTPAIGATTLETYYKAIRYNPAGGTPKLTFDIINNADIDIQNVYLQPLGGSPAIPSKKTLPSNFIGKRCDYGSNYSLELDGIKDSLIAYGPNHAFQNFQTNADREGTFATWLYIPRTGIINGTYFPIFSVGDITNTNGHVINIGVVYQNATNGFEITVKFNDLNNNGYLYQSIGPLYSLLGIDLLDEWNHIVVTYDGLGNTRAAGTGLGHINGISVFVNGNLITNAGTPGAQYGETNANYTSLGAPTPANSPWIQMVGAIFQPGGNTYSKILFDDMAQWNVALSQTNVAAIYNGGQGLNLTLNNLPGTYTNAGKLIKLYTFDDGWHWSQGAYAPSSGQPNMVMTGGFVPAPEVLTGPQYLFGKAYMLEGGIANTNTPF